MATLGFSLCRILCHRFHLLIASLHFLRGLYGHIGMPSPPPFHLRSKSTPQPCGVGGAGDSVSHHVRTQRGIASWFAKLYSSCFGFFFFCFCFFERMWSFFILWVFLCVCSQIGLVTVFMGLFLGFIFCFSGFGDWVWLLDLDLGFARDWFGCFLDLGRTWRKFPISI